LSSLQAGAEEQERPEAVAVAAAFLEDQRQIQAQGQEARVALKSPVV
jgi:hypothetical protein